MKLNRYWFVAAALVIGGAALLLSHRTGSARSDLGQLRTAVASSIKPEDFASKFGKAPRIGTAKVSHSGSAAEQGLANLASLKGEGPSTEQAPAPLAGSNIPKNLIPNQGRLSVSQQIR